MRRVNLNRTDKHLPRSLQISPFSPPGKGTAERREPAVILREPLRAARRGAGGRYLPVQKPTSAEGSQAAARQDKLSSIPPTDAGPALPGGAQSEPPRPGPATMPQAPRRPSRDTPRCRRRPLPPRLPAAPAKTRSGGWVGGGRGSALGGRAGLKLRRQPRPRTGTRWALRPYTNTAAPEITGIGTVGTGNPPGPPAPVASYLRPVLKW